MQYIIVKFQIFKILNALKTKGKLNTRIIEGQHS